MYTFNTHTRISFIYIFDIYICNRIKSLDVSVMYLPHICKVVVDSESQLDNWEVLRRGLSSDKWSFMRPGEEAQVAADNIVRDKRLARARARALSSKF